MFENSENIRINLIEVEDATELAGALFKQSFNDIIPNFPKHFVLLVTNEKQQKVTLGYVHFTKHLNMYLGGGMCVATQALRQLPKSLRVQLNQAVWLTPCFQNR